MLCFERWWCLKVRENPGVLHKNYILQPFLSLCCERCVHDAKIESEIVNLFELHLAVGCERHKQEIKTGRRGQCEGIEIIVTIQEGNEYPLYMHDMR